MILNPKDFLPPAWMREEALRCSDAKELAPFDICLAVDVNNVMYRLAFATSKDNYTAEELLTAFVEDVVNAQFTVEADGIVCAIDHGIPLRRSMMGAVAKRNKTPEQDAVIKLARDAIGMLKARVIHEWLNPTCLDGYEADDIIAAVVYSAMSARVVIYSTDSDMYQLHNGEIVTQFSPATQAFVVIKDAVPHQIPAIKALAGDPSDNIVGIKGVGPKTALTVLNGNKTLDLPAEEIKRVKNNLMLTTLPMPGAYQCLKRNFVPANKPPSEDDTYLPF